MTRRRSGLSVAVMAAGSIALFASPAHAGHGVNCSDFETQAEAQDYFDENGPGDPEGLDEDDDGEACETLPRGSGGGGGGGGADDSDSDSDEGGASGNDSGTPRGGVAAGAGGMAAASSPVLPAAGAVFGTLLVGAGVMASRRRALGE